MKHANEQVKGSGETHVEGMWRALGGWEKACGKWQRHEMLEKADCDRC